MNAATSTLVAAAVAPGTFTTLHIAVTALLTAAVGLPFALWRLRPTFPGEAWVLAVLAGAAVLAWRLSANMPQLNDDGASPFSANDWAAPMLTYVVLSCYAGLRTPADWQRFSQVRGAHRGEPRRQRRCDLTM